MARLNSSSMPTASQYLAETESAVLHLFRGIDSYLKVLQAEIPTFVSDHPFGPAQEAEYRVWESENKGGLDARRQAEQRFVAESFALDILCGSVLQVAEKALDLYCEAVPIPIEWSSTVNSSKAKYCRGRLIRTVPLGLIIYAGRNQHMHFGEKLHELNVTVFERLATAHGYPTSARDPAVDLSNPSVFSFARNITYLLGWNTYDQYVQDMRALLEI